ncbi:hypothetical protein [uncultured Flavobacterium sp.]|uniref:hypothetical protein n=1 Tax=uncultured Flavobacterium sp. TaxID=165435 RepID=UPI0025E2E1F9|nr:hypothetical protein [uncultured Flavobacterium sp.]
MKTIILFLLVAFTASAQGFRAEKGKVVWEHFYAEEGTTIKSAIESREKMKLESTDLAAMSGKADGIKSTLDINSARLESDANFDFTVTKVEGGYKVVVTNYTLLEKYGPLQMRIIPASLGKYYMDNNKLRTSEKTKTDLAYIDAFLTSVFLPKVMVPVTEGGTIAVNANPIAKR